MLSVGTELKEKLREALSVSDVGHSLSVNRPHTVWNDMSVSVTSHIDGPL